MKVGNQLPLAVHMNANFRLSPMYCTGTIFLSFLVVRPIKTSWGPTDEQTNKYYLLKNYFSRMYNYFLRVKVYFIQKTHWMAFSPSMWNCN